MNAPATGIVNIRGKEYKSVALRVHEFRSDHSDWSLPTEILQMDSDVVVMRASVVNPDGQTLATGHSEEYRKSSQVNRTSALENAETSAIGRALANFGYGGTEFASANEVQNAIHQQEGQSQGDDQGAVSSPAPKNWGGRYPTKTALKKAMHEHHAELDRLRLHGALSDLEGYMTSPEYQDYIAVAGIHAPAYLEGPLPESAPPEFVQTFALEQLAKDAIALRGNQALEEEPEE